MSLHGLVRIFRQTADRLRELTRRVQAINQRLDEVESSLGQLDVTAAAADSVPWASHFLAHEWVLCQIGGKNGDGTYDATRCRATGFGTFAADPDDAEVILVYPLTDGDLVTGTYQYAHFDGLTSGGVPIYHVIPTYKFCLVDEPPAGCVAESSGSCP
jgi:hypothetical protein